jgi:asparagine synthase (glutamine-hydrolysing)
MNKVVCQLVQQTDTGWIVSLGDGVSMATGGRDQRGAPVSGIASTDAERRRGIPGPEDEPAYASLAVAEDASCKVFFDGWLYNRAELRDRFAASSAPGASDADLILRAYLRWDEDVLNHVKGVFALLIWDKRRNALLCARDPLGIYPLFYADAGRELLFSTSIEALVRHPRVSDTVNRAALADHLCARWPKQEETFFEAVYRVPLGHALRVRGTGRDQYRYWDTTLPEIPINDPRTPWITEDELEQFDELLDQTVNRHLQLGRAGIFLSGGLDSVSIAAVAADNSRRSGLPPPLALSLVFPTPETNEEDVQRGVSSSLGLPHKLMPLDEAAGPQGLLGSAMEMSSTWPVPLQNPWSVTYQNLGLEGKRQGCRVVLSGQGGDEWLIVGPYYAADLLGARDFKGLYQLYKTHTRSFRLSRLYLMRNLLWKFGARPQLGKAARTILRREAPGILRQRRRWVISRSTPDWVAPDSMLRQELFERGEQELSSRPEPQSFYHSMGRQPIESSVISMSMEEQFESGRRIGLLQLMPYWDPEVIDFLTRVPPALLNQDGLSKALVRQTLHRRFPNLGFERQKKVRAFGFYRAAQLDEGPRLWKSVGGAQALADLGIVDAQALNSHISNLFSDAQPQFTYRIKEILMLEAWLRPRLGLPLSFSSEGQKR